ncbi:hypothetical protein [Streptomyces sp. NPDC058695]|uniref:hypothetical protein n=1 Tax=Streptomyces sp. NPDC058695 TaxID=3346604 RepID=UPI0036551931
MIRLTGPPARERYESVDAQTRFTEDGEQLVGRERRFLDFASVAVDDREAAELVQMLRERARVRQAGELNFRLFKDDPLRWSLLEEAWGPGGALHDRCSVYVVDKEYAAAAKVIDLLLEEKEHAEGKNLYAGGQARGLARILAVEGPRALHGSLFEELMSSFVALASQRGVRRSNEATQAFFAVIDRAWAASTRTRGALGIIGPSAIVAPTTRGSAEVDVPVRTEHTDQTNRRISRLNADS